MTTMVEKVARALAKADGTSPDEMFVDKRSEKRGWEFYMEDATAAIEAMMEPTEDMRIAALNTSLPSVGEPPLYEKCWRRMIQAALEEKQ